MPIEKYEEAMVGVFRKFIKQEISFNEFISNNKQFIGIIHKILLGEIKGLGKIEKFITEFGLDIKISSNSKIILGVEIKPNSYIKPFIVIRNLGKDDSIQLKFTKNKINRKKLGTRSPLFIISKNYNRKNKLTISHLKNLIEKTEALFIPDWDDL